MLRKVFQSFNSQQMLIVSRNNSVKTSNPSSSTERQDDYRLQTDNLLIDKKKEVISNAKDVKKNLQDSNPLPPRNPKGITEEPPDTSQTPDNIDVPPKNEELPKAPGRPKMTEIPKEPKLAASSDSEFTPVSSGPLLAGIKNHPESHLKNDLPPNLVMASLNSKQESVSCDEEDTFTLTRKHSNFRPTYSSLNETSVTQMSGKRVNELPEILHHSQPFIPPTAVFPVEKQREVSSTLPPIGKPRLKDTIPVIIKELQREKLKSLGVKTFNEVPGPTLLYLINKIWQAIPVVASQIVATSLFTLQRLMVVYDKDNHHSRWFPYNQILDKYGSIVRLHSPIGADLVLLAVDGSSVPLITQPTVSTSSLFDSLTEYRNNSYHPSLSRLNLNEARKSVSRVEMNSEVHLAQVDEISCEFIRKIKLMKNYHTGLNETFHFELVKWSLACTWMIYFQRKLNYFNDTFSDGYSQAPIVDSDELFKRFTSLINALNMSETGIQVWRLMKTSSWNSIVEDARAIDGFLMNSVERAISELNRGGPKEGKNLSLVQNLFLSGDLKTDNYLTQLLDVIILNTHIGAQAAGFLMYHLAKNPLAQKKVTGEIMDAKDDMFMDATKFKFLYACLLESVRLKPPVPWLARLLKEDGYIQGYHIPKGTLIQMITKVGENNDEFRPEQWQDGVFLTRGDPFLSLPKWKLSPAINRDMVVQQIMILMRRFATKFQMEISHEDLKQDGMVLSSPTSPYFLKLTEYD